MQRSPGACRPVAVVVRAAPDVTAACRAPCSQRSPGACRPASTPVADRQSFHSSQAPVCCCVCVCACVKRLLCSRSVSSCPPRWPPVLVPSAEPTFLQWSPHLPPHCSLCPCVCVCACVCVLGLLSPRCLSVDHPRWSPCLLLFAEPTFLQWACRPPLHCSLCLPVRVSGYDAPCPPAGFRRPRGAHAATAPCCTCCGGCGPAAWGTHFGASPPVPDPGELLSRFALRCSSLSMS